MADFTIRQNDRLPPIVATLKDATGAAVDLSPASTAVKFQMVDSGNAVKINAAATINSPASAGVVQYDWAAGDTDTAGAYSATWEVTWAGGKKQTFPTATNLSISVVSDLA